MPPSSLADFKHLMAADDGEGLAQVLAQESTVAWGNARPADFWMQLWSQLSWGAQGRTQCVEALARHAPPDVLVAWYIEVFQRSASHPWLPILEAHVTTPRLLSRAVHLGHTALVEACVQRWGDTWNPRKVAPSISEAAAVGHLNALGLLLRRWPQAPFTVTSLAEQGEEGSRLAWKMILPHMNEKRWVEVGEAALNIHWIEGLKMACAGLATTTAHASPMPKIVAWWDQALSSRWTPAFDLLVPHIPRLSQSVCLVHALSHDVHKALHVLVPRMAEHDLERTRRRLLRRRPPEWSMVDSLGQHVSPDLRATWVRESGARLPRTLMRARDEQAQAHGPSCSRVRVRS